MERIFKIDEETARDIYQRLLGIYDSNEELITLDKEKSDVYEFTKKDFRDEIEEINFRIDRILSIMQKCEVKNDNH